MKTLLTIVMVLFSTIFCYASNELVIDAANNLAKNGSTVEIIKISGSDVTVDVTPYYEIINQTNTTITYKIINSHPLASKMLNFEIELLDITKG